MKSSVDLNTVCNYLNETVEQSPQFMTALLSIVVKGSVNELQDSRIFSSMSENCVAVDLIGFLSGMGDGKSMIAPEFDISRKLLGFRTVNIDPDSEHWFKAE